MFLSLPLTAIINLPEEKARLKIVPIFSLTMKLVCIYYFKNYIEGLKRRKLKIIHNLITQNA